MFIAQPPQEGGAAGGATRGPADWPACSSSSGIGIRGFLFGPLDKPIRLVLNEENYNTVHDLPTSSLRSSGFGYAARVHWRQQMHDWGRIQ
jgi:hypothetical protein